jgi:hypothetical protein
MVLVPRAFARAAVVAAAAMTALSGCASDRTRAPSAGLPAAPSSTAPSSKECCGIDCDPGDRCENARSPLDGAEEKGTDHERASPGELARDLDDATLERRAFRQVLVGMTALPPLRLTWLLLRGKERVRLHLFCQSSKEPLRLGPDRQEERETSWLPATRIAFEGARAADRTPMRLATAMDLGDMWACVQVARTLTMTCRPSLVRTVSAAAALRSNDADHTWRWEPSAQESIQALVCLLRGVPVDPEAGSECEPINAHSPGGPRGRPEWELVFAEARQGTAGVEWVNENSEGLLQTGAYRWMPAVP